MNIGLFLGLAAVGLLNFEARADVISDFQTIRELLSTSVSTPSSCQIGETPEKSTSLCSFKEFCNKIKPNQGNGYIYENSNGEKIPNYTLMNYEGQFIQCFKRKYIMEKAALNVHAERTSSNNKKLEKLKSLKKLHESIHIHGDQELIEAMNEIVLDEAIEQAEQSSVKNGKLFEIKTRKEIEAEIRVLEKKANDKLHPHHLRETRLSEVTRNALIASKLLEQPDLEESISFLPEYLQPRVAGEYLAWKPINKDPFLNIEVLENTNFVGAHEMESSRERYQSRLDHVYSIFEKVKKKIVKRLNQLANGKNEKELNSMIQRIQTISMNLPEQCPGPNAYYSRNTHSFTLCSNILGLPEMALVEAIAHELGHSIDPCNLTGNLLTQQIPERKPNDSDPHSLETKKNKEVAANFGLFHFVPQLPSQGRDTKRFECDTFGSSTQNGSQVVTEGVGLSKNPLKGVINCLASKESVCARLPHKEEVEEDLRVAIEQARKASQSESSERLSRLKHAKENLDTLMEEKGACDILTHSSPKTQINEAFSDWIASQVVASEVEDAAPKDQKRLAFESIAFSLGVGCLEGIEQFRTKMEEKLIALGCKQKQNISATASDLNAISDAENIVTDVHSPDAERVEKIIFTHPTLRKSFGCAPLEGVKYCE